MTVTFEPPIGPSLESQAAKRARVLVSTFGDGYRQRTADGINNLNCTFSLIWHVLTQDQAQEITGFFEDRAGWESFFYKLPWDTVSRLWTCTSWTSVVIGGGTLTDTDDYTDLILEVSASFEEEFDLVTDVKMLSLGAANTALVASPGSEITVAASP